MKKKIKVNYTKFPTFEEFVNQKSIENLYDFGGVNLRRRVFISGYNIVVLYEALVKKGYNTYNYEYADKEEFPLTTIGYLNMQMYIHRWELSEKCLLEQVTPDVIQETYKLFDEYKEKVKALEVKHE